MATIRFTGTLARHRPAPTLTADGATVRELLDRAFAGDTLLRSYILDDQGRVRRHVNIFVNGEMIADRARLSDPVGPAAEVYISGAFRRLAMDMLWVASRKGLFRFSANSSGGWRQADEPEFLAQPVTAILDDPRDGAVYAALRLGHFGCKLHRSDDRGASWTELAAPVYPASGAEDAPTLDMIWTLAAGGADQPGLIWAGTLPGGLFVSRDRGDSWALIESLWNRPERARWFGGGYDHPGIHSILVDPRDSRRLTVGVSCGGVWLSDDSGASWEQGGQGLRAEFLPPDQAYDPVSQDPHLIAACRADPDRVWCQHHNGIFVSSDRGRNFSEITDVKPSAFGFAVVAHPDRPDWAWFAPGVKDECRVPVGGRLEVTHTRDGGARFVRLTAGLPDRNCYDLIFRHALVCDDTGQRLAMGSTTGNLWLSPDGGENWRLLSSTLPPIAQLAFAGGA